MGIFKKAKEFVDKAAKDIEEKTSDALMNEELNPTLRKHHGEPIKKPAPKPKES